jgi:hypothetical protein
VKIKKSMFYFISSLVVLLVFQACGQQSPNVLFSESSPSRSLTETEDNGHPYDGKIYILTGDVCPDGTRIQARIVLKDSSSADLVRKDCEEIRAVALGPADFQLNPNNSRELQFQNQTFVNRLVGTKIEMSLVTQEIGYCYWLQFDFGTPADNDTLTAQSLLQVYEDGKPLGPAHTIHDDIRYKGLGVFSHWKTFLRFSASDNTNPLTNGRVYTWDVN